MIRRFTPPAPAGPHCRHKRLHRRLAGCERNEGPEGLQGHIADRREASSPATEWRARLRPRWLSGSGNPTPTAHPPQCYGRGRLVGFRGDRLCLVPLPCASEGGGPWGPRGSARRLCAGAGFSRAGRSRSEADAMEAQRAFKATFPTAGRDASLEPFFPPFLSVQKGGPRRIGAWRLRS